jgi:NAD(P)-dependent dehydrogenase (short-subunit alcohol dehydrogenase family)
MIRAGRRSDRGKSMASTVWFVTGSSRGLGRQIVEAALAAGHQVAATARRPDDLADLVASRADQVRAYPLDVTDADAAKSAVEGAWEDFGAIDVVVSNAGYADFASVEDSTLAAFRRQVETNFFGVVNVTKAVLPLMHARRSGHLITVSSVGGRVANPGLAAYQAAKWAVNGFTEVLAQEVAPLGIKVTTIEPGGMPTDWAGSSMTVGPIGDGYEATVGKFATLLRGGDSDRGASVSGSDLAKVAQVVLSVAEMDEPSARLLLGSDAVTVARYTAQALAERDSQWETLSRSSDKNPANRDMDPLAGQR